MPASRTVTRQRFSLTVSTLSHAFSTFERMLIIALILTTAFSSHLRTTDPFIGHMIAGGVARSPMFASLVHVIERANVIVYVERPWGMPRNLGGVTRLVTATAGVRYVRVSVNAALIGDQLTALLAHEFQHVVELASREDVVDRAAFAALYRRIGYSSGERSYETEAAQEVERRVLTELFAANRASRRARARDRESRRAHDGPDRAVRRADPPPASPRVPCPE
jgi:hypothetical protein